MDVWECNSCAFWYYKEKCINGQFIFWLNGYFLYKNSIVQGKQKRYDEKNMLQFTS